MELTLQRSVRRAPAPGALGRDGVHRAENRGGAVDRNERSRRNEQALVDLERVVSLIKSANFVACAPTFTDVHVISTAMADRLLEVLGPARGIGARATIGVQSLAGNHCYESWM